jgi:hypothetical protein
VNSAARPFPAPSWPYLVWGGSSALVLLLAGLVDPYALAFVSLGAGAGSAALPLWTLIRRWRRWPWALAACLPTAAAAVVVMRTRWA